VQRLRRQAQIFEENEVSSWEDAIDYQARKLGSPSGVFGGHLLKRLQSGEFRKNVEKRPTGAPDIAFQFLCANSGAFSGAVREIRSGSISDKLRADLDRWNGAFSYSSGGQGFVDVTEIARQPAADAQSALAKFQNDYPLLVERDGVVMPLEFSSSEFRSNPLGLMTQAIQTRLLAEYLIQNAEREKVLSDISNGNVQLTRLHDDGIGLGFEYRADCQDAYSVAKPDRYLRDASFRARAVQMQPEQSDAGQSDILRVPLLEAWRKSSSFENYHTAQRELAKKTARLIKEKSQVLQLLTQEEVVNLSMQSGETLIWPQRRNSFRARSIGNMRGISSL
jgi:hypothetical protein